MGQLVMPCSGTLNCGRNCEWGCAAWLLPFRPEFHSPIKKTDEVGRGRNLRSRTRSLVISVILTLPQTQRMPCVPPLCPGVRKKTPYPNSSPVQSTLGRPDRSVGRTTLAGFLCRGQTRLPVCRLPTARKFFRPQNLSPTLLCPFARWRVQLRSSLILQRVRGSTSQSSLGTRTA
jgi:hypothetical protein